MKCRAYLLLVERRGGEAEKKEEGKGEEERERENDLEILALRVLHGNRVNAAVNSWDEAILLQKYQEKRCTPAEHH